MNTQEISAFLAKVELFENFTEAELNKMAELAKVEKLNANSVLFKENSVNRSIIIISDGEVELLKASPNGDTRRIAYFRVKEFLGEGTILGNAPHTTTARTAVPSEVIYIDSVKVKEFIDKNSKAGVKLLTTLSRVISRRMSFSNSKFLSSGTEYGRETPRLEHDLLGEKEVPGEAYYGIQTMRAIENFHITGVPLRFYPLLIESLAIVKQSAVRANHELGLIESDLALAIDNACSDIINGMYRKDFIVDMIQGGAGTSTNMNANEVIANKALEILGHKRGEYKYCHPNNHVNLSQSTNDAYPTAVKIALRKSNKKLVKALLELVASFQNKADDFADVIKMGRTQLQDAVPMTMGQEFEAYSATLEEETVRLTTNANLFLEVNMGATAIGTGINSDPDYRRKVIGHLRDITGMDIVLARNLVEATQDTGSFIMYSSALKRLAVKLSKISSDLRLMSSGPRTGFGEINLPPMQPGSSIMPGKVNPVIPEVVNQIAYKVIGNDLTVTMAAEAGQLELNVMEPVIVQSILESIDMLINGMNTLRFRCVDGITANREVCRKMVENSIGLVTALNPALGYETSSMLAKEALEQNRGVYELVLEKELLSKEELDEMLKPENMIKPQRRIRK